MFAQVDRHYLKDKNENDRYDAAEDEETRIGRKLIEVGYQQEWGHDGEHDEAEVVAILATLVKLIGPLTSEQVSLTSQVHTLRHRKRHISKEKNRLTESLSHRSVACVCHVREVNDALLLESIPCLQQEVTCTEANQVYDD